MERRTRSIRGLTSKRWKFKIAENTEILDSNENKFLKDIYTQLSGYEDRQTFKSILSRLIRKHAIDVVSEKLYEKHGCRFLDLLISEDDNNFYSLEICFG